MKVKKLEEMTDEELEEYLSILNENAFNITIEKIDVYAEQERRKEGI